MECQTEKVDESVNKSPKFSEQEQNYPLKNIQQQQQQNLIVHTPPPELILFPVLLLVIVRACAWFLYYPKSLFFFLTSLNLIVLLITRLFVKHKFYAESKNEIKWQRKRQR